MGGRIAEEMIFGKDNVTSGASNDLQQATRIARGMVMSFGMSDRVGKTSFDPEKLHLLAPETRLAIDEEITRLLSQSYERATQLLKNNRRDLEVVAKGLIEHETLSGEDVECLLKGRKLKRELEKVWEQWKWKSIRVTVTVKTADGVVWIIGGVRVSVYRVYLYHILDYL